MPVTATTIDEHENTVTMVADFAAPPDRVWRIYADPRQLERVWGPPGYPATVVEHNLTPGGRVTYYMTSPEGDRYCGLWQVQRVDPGTELEFRDLFTDDTFTPSEDMPVSTSVFTFQASDDGTRVTYRSTFTSREGLQRVLKMGMIEGATGATNQIDDLLAQDEPRAADLA